MKYTFVFPGQGSQFVGMGKELADNFQSARDVFQEVNDAVSQDLFKLMVEGPEHELTLTANAQPALMANSMAVVRVLEKDFGIKLKDKASFVAGHSLGEYSAACAAGVFSLRDTAKLLRTRGEAMQQAVPVGVGGMAAVIGVSYQDVQALAEACADDNNLCVPPMTMLTARSSFPDIWPPSTKPLKLPLNSEPSAVSNFRSAHLSTVL